MPAKMDFDKMLEELGEMGKYQIRTYLLICLPVLFAAANSLSYVFTAGVPNYRCKVPECDHEDFPIFDQRWVRYAVPESPNNLDDSFKPSQCQRYQVNNSLVNGTCHKQLFTREVVECYDWVFDKESTIVNEWNITCLKNQWKLSLVGSSHFAGIIVGSALFGFMADKFGRKYVFIFCTVLMSISGMLQIFSPEYITFTSLIFVHALGTSGVYPLAFIIGVELVGRKKRELTGTVLNYFYAVGEALVAVIAWGSRDWKILQVSISAPALLFISYAWLIPESVRWLIAKDKNKRVKGIVCKVAEVNNVKLSPSIIKSFDDESEALNDEKTSETHLLPVLKTILHNKKLVVRYLITFYIWAVNAFVYYGLSLNATSMSGNKYLNFGLVCLIEIPGYTLAWISIHKWGRRPSLIGSLLLCGITCSLSLVATGTAWLTMLLFLLGKLGITAAFGVSYVHTAEMFPTVIRSGGVGTASTIARIGALLAPFVPLLGLYVHYMPMLLFGTIAISAGLLAIKLPETLGIMLPETVEEANQI